VLPEFMFGEMVISGEGDILDPLAIASHNAVKDDDAIRPDVGFGIDLNIEETPFAKSSKEVLTSFLDQVRCQATFLIDRQQTSSLPGAFDMHLDRWTRFYVE